MSKPRRAPGSAAPTKDYRTAGAEIVGDAKAVFDKAGMIVKVKEPQASERGGCFETSRPTTHAEPTYVIDGIVHYCVANMPGAVPRTSTYALTTT